MTPNVIDMLPTSDINQFRYMLQNPNVPIRPTGQKNTGLQQFKKNIVMAYPSDSTGCGNIRTIVPFTFLNSVYGKSGDFNVMISSVMVIQPEVLQRTRSIWFQRTMGPDQIGLIQHYKECQKQYGFKMIYDIDDFIWHWKSDDKDGLPEYNFGKTTITQAVMDACVTIMKMMDLICVSTEYLGKYISETFDIPKDRFLVVQNTIPQYMWGNKQKRPITKKIEKPRVVWTASPTHWNDVTKMKGDMDNAWYDWVIKNVNAGKIDYIQMGGLPYFFEGIKDKITVIPWVHSFQYHNTLKDVKPDFGIGPLVNNHFNMAKSNIKAIEQYTIGSVFLGSVFNDNEFSPYQDSFVPIKEGCTVEDIDNAFWRLTEPDVYNDILKKQYNYLTDKGHYLESQEFVNKMMSIL